MIFRELKCPVEAKRSCVSLFHSHCISPSVVNSFTRPSFFFILLLQSFSFLAPSLLITSFSLFFFPLHHSYATLVSAGAFGYKLFCWLSICYLIVYPFALPHFHSILSSLFLRCHPLFPLLPSSIPKASEFPKPLAFAFILSLAPPPFPPIRLMPFQILPRSGCTVAQCWVVLLKLDDVLGY